MKNRAEIKWKKGKMLLWKEEKSCARNVGGSGFFRCSSFTERARI